jgi:tRNA(Arg) A34 adenosine deaminase TadA
MGVQVLIPPLGGKLTVEDPRWMLRALEPARQAAAAGEVPVGAVPISGREAIGEGWNRPIGSHDPSAHAQMVALRAAAQRAGITASPEPRSTSPSSPASCAPAR